MRIVVQMSSDLETTPLEALVKRELVIQAEGPSEAFQAAARAYPDLLVTGFRVMPEETLVIADTEDETDA